MRKLKGEIVPQVALVPSSFTPRNETIAHLIANGYVADEVAPIYGLSKSHTNTIARDAGVKRTRGSTRAVDPLKIVAALRAPGVVSKGTVTESASISITTLRRLLVALGMDKSITRLHRLRRYAVRQSTKREVTV